MTNFLTLRKYVKPTGSKIINRCWRCGDTTCHMKPYIIQVFFFDHVFCHCPLTVIESIVIHKNLNSTFLDNDKQQFPRNTSENDVEMSFTKLETTRLETYAFDIPLV